MNGLVGSFPSELFLLTGLEEVSLRENRLDGSIPLWGLKEMTNLRKFALKHNDLTGTIPEELYLLSDLEILKIGRNFFNGTISSGLS